MPILSWSSVASPRLRKSTHFLLASMHHWTSRSVVRGLGSAACAKPRLEASCLTTAMATSFPAAIGNFPNTLWLSSFPFWISDVNDAHSEYIPPLSESCRTSSNGHYDCHSTCNIPNDNILLISYTQILTNYYQQAWKVYSVPEYIKYLHELFEMCI